MPRFYSGMGPIYTVGRSHKPSAYDRRVGVVARRYARDIRRTGITGAVRGRRFQGGRRKFSAALLRSGGFSGLETNFKDYEYDGVVDNQVTNAVQSHAGATKSILEIDQGTGNNGRNGRHIDIKSIQFKGTLQLNTSEDQTAPVEPVHVKAALVLDKQCNGADMGGDLIWKNPTDADLDAFAFRNLENTQRFQVLWTKDFIINPLNLGQSAVTSGTTSTSVHKKMEFFVPLNLRTYYDGTGNGVADITDNNISLCVIRSRAAAGVTVLQGLMRIRFNP